MHITKFAGIGRLALAVLLTVVASDAKAEFQYRFTIPGVEALEPGVEDELQSPSGPFASCRKILESDASAASGLHEIEVGGIDFDVYCDMDSDGGGWTMVAALFEGQAVGWGQGIQPTYDPSLESMTAFSLDDSEIPLHEELGFGRDKQATFVEFVDFQYHTGDIDDVISGSGSTSLNGVILTGKKTGHDFHLHRSSNFFYRFLDTDSNTQHISSPISYLQTLMFGPIPNSGDGFDYGYRGNAKGWVYHGLDGDWKRPGRALGDGVNDADLYKTHQDYAWTLWVR